MDDGPLTPRSAGATRGVGSPRMRRTWGGGQAAVQVWRASVRERRGESVATTARGFAEARSAVGRVAFSAVVVVATRATRLAHAGSDDLRELSW